MYKLNEVCFNRGEEQIFSSLNLNIQSGEKLILAGYNGIGKTTLLKLLAGIYFSTSGDILFNNEVLTKKRLKENDFRKYFRQSVALLFQNIDAMLFNPTVYDEIAFTPRQLKMDNIDELVKSAAEMCGVGGLLTKTPFKLSGGQKQKVALASILVHNPKVLLLDEPSSSLDGASMKSVGKILNSLRDTTIIIVSHDNDFTDGLDAKEINFIDLLRQA
jgi:cobalt/nickel transport system ATP-binding protein